VRLCRHRQVHHSSPQHGGRKPLNAHGVGLHTSPPVIALPLQKLSTPDQRTQQQDELYRLRQTTNETRTYEKSKGLLEFPDGLLGQILGGATHDDRSRWPVEGGGCVYGEPEQGWGSSVSAPRVRAVRMAGEQDERRVRKLVSRSVRGVGCTLGNVKHSASRCASTSMHGPGQRGRDAVAVAHDTRLAPRPAKACRGHQGRGVSVSASADGADRGAPLKRPRRSPARRPAANGRRATRPGGRSQWCLGTDRAGRYSGDQILSKMSSGHRPNYEVC